MVGSVAMVVESVGVASSSDTAGEFRRTLREGAHKLLRDSVSDTSQGSYQIAWTRWKDYLHRFFNVPRVGSLQDHHYLPFHWPLSIVSDMLHMFAYFMFSIIGLSAARVKHQISALSWHFGSRGCDISVFRWAEISMLRQGLTRQPVIGEVVSRRRVPVTMEMVQRIYHEYSTERRLDQRVFAVAFVLGFCCLLRPSEYCWGTSTNKHVLRASAFEFECENPDRRTGLVGAHQVHRVPWSRIRLLRIYMNTAKNFRTGRALWFSVGTNIQAFHLVKVMYDWACDSRPGISDCMLSWPNGGSIVPRDSLMYADFTKVVKYAASLYDFAPDLFGGHSLRVGGATLLRAAGATDGEICLMGRWKSLPSCLGYQEVSTATHDRMLNMLLTTGAYTNRDIRLQYRLPTVHNASLADILSDSDDDVRV
jgi:hypothetical protein